MIMPRVANVEILRARRGSELHKRFGLYVEHVGVLSSYPEDYEARLRPMFSGAFEHLNFLVLEAHDLALTKIERNAPRDIKDVRFLASGGLIDPDTLVNRYFSEMRPSLAAGNTLKQIEHNMRLWLEDFWPTPRLDAWPSDGNHES